MLADPLAPHVLENLNGFLKRRPSYRTYGVSVPLSELDRYFERTDDRAPAASPSSTTSCERWLPRSVTLFVEVHPGLADHS